MLALLLTTLALSGALGASGVANFCDSFLGDGLMVERGLDGIRVRRTLMAYATASSTATASSSSTGGTAVAEAVAEAVAKGDANAIADAVSSAVSEGGLASALSVAEAVTEALHDGAPLDAIAEAIADATSVDRDTIEEYLRRNDTEALAHAIASSQGGHTYAEATSVAEAMARQTDAVIDAIDHVFYWVDGGGRADAVIDREAIAIGEAFAEVFVDTVVLLEVEGYGEAYGISSAKAMAVAQAFAQVILRGIARASNKFGVAVAAFDGEAIATAFAEAAATAFAEGDLQGSGHVEVTQTSVATAVANPVASVLLNAVAYAYGHSTMSSVFIESDASVENEHAKATSEGFSAIGGVGVADASGNAAASTQYVARCHGSARRCCSLRSVRQTTCPCPRSQYGDCHPFEAAVRDSGKTTHWKDMRSEDICYC